ncbi:S8 family peptidase [Streptomyces sp. NBC_00237]|uniref:S8 family peptidase n=1 Tax=Streptomyces sp. NBC_00237 TaxID=2975687 RepID=UPI00224D3B2A|nr:S8 family peptidase [Streptomyces sp. NBC_00237]MCX5204100.1 S8 family peptidase [Streptomyces sp. NBC_00237]
MALSRQHRRHRPHWLRAAGACTAVTLAAGLSAVTLPAQAAAPAAEGRVVGAGAAGSVGNSYIVTLASGAGGVKAPTAEGRALAAKYGAKIRHTYSSALNGYALKASSAQARRLAADPKVASVTQDTTVSLKHTQKNPPSWGLDRIDQDDLPLDRSYTWPESAGAGVHVYVIDSGLRTTHQDFGGRASSGWDFVENDPVAQDANGHGTHVAGTAVGETYGVAKKAEVVGVRVLDGEGGGTTASVIAGIDWVAKNARKPAVANMSLGGVANAQLDAAVRNAIASGVTFVLAAGNDSLPASLFSPGRVKEGLTVGASDIKDRQAPFSNWGTRLDLYAPGVDITSALSADDTAKGVSSGTSMAAPHVTGAAALYLADHAWASPAEVGKALTGRAVTGKVKGAGLGSPNRLLHVRNP